MTKLPSSHINRTRAHVISTTCARAGGVRGENNNNHQLVVNDDHLNGQRELSERRTQ